MFALIFVCLWQHIDGRRIATKSISKASTLVCCCRGGRCSHNEYSNATGERERAIERSHPLLQCCKFAKRSCSGFFWSFGIQHPQSQCINERKREIQTAIDNAEPANDADRGECRGQLKNFTELVKKKVKENKDGLLHGTGIHEIHDAHIAEDINYKLLVKGEELSTDFVGANIFTHDATKKTNLLWNKIKREDRLRWKRSMEAGELSRDDDTIFAQIVEDPSVDQLMACNYSGPVRKLWAAASLTYSGMAAGKALVIIIGANDTSQLANTMFWKAEIRGVAKHPPKGGISVVSVGRLNCNDLMIELTRGFEGQVQEAFELASVDKWAETQFFTCRSASSLKPNHDSGTPYRYPFQDKVDERKTKPGFWESLGDRGGGVIDGLELGPFQCYDEAMRLEPGVAERMQTKKKEQIKSCDTMMQTMPRHVTEHYIKSLSKCCHIIDNPRIRFYHLATYLFESTSTDITDAGLQELKCPNLVSLDVSWSDISDAGLVELAKSCNQLDAINLKKNSEVTMAGVREFCRKCTQLTKVSLGDGSSRFFDHNNRETRKLVKEFPNIAFHIMEEEID